MDFSVILQLKNKKFWWMDVIFYFVMSLLIATLFCYGIFFAKNSILKKQIYEETAKLQTVGTPKQKAEEKEVLNYRAKINDFSNLLKNHEFASNAFIFLESQTMPNIWFKQIGLDEKSATVQLSGEAENMNAFSRQVAAFENNEYVKNLGTLNSSLGESARISFNIYLELDKSVFSYLSISEISGKESSSKKSSEKQNKTQENSDQNASGKNTISNILKNKK